MEEAEAQQAAERYAKMEAELQALRQQNEELMRALRERQELVAAERLRGDRRARAQMQEFANLTAELLAGQQGPAGTVGRNALERQSQETRTVRWRQGKGSRYVAVSSARTSGVVDGTSKRTRSICHVLVTWECSSVVEGGL